MYKEITNDVRDSSLVCLGCDSLHLIRVVGDEPSIHYGRLICGDCGRFIKWLPKPKSKNTPNRANGRGLDIDISSKG